MPSRVKKPAYYYHVTSEYWGASKILYPRVNGDNRGEDEPKVSRICVGPDWVRCLAAIPFSCKTYFVYRTARRIKPYYPRNVYDSRSTREKWIKNRCRFKLVGKVSLANFRERAPCLDVRGFYKYFLRRARKELRFVPVSS